MIRVDGEQARRFVRRTRLAIANIGTRVAAWADPAHREPPRRRSVRPETAEERAIRQYVEAESVDEPDDPVESVELVKRHRVLGESHEIFDVRCKRSRWWVITNLTNLYSQDEFRTADDAFSFHLGLMLRLWERDRVTVDDDARAVSERAWRKYEDAVEAMADANDTEDYQSVGVRLREAMLALVRDESERPWVDDIATRPQAANIKDWLEIFALKITAKRRQRAYLRSIWEKAWDLSVHLQHDSSAVPWDAEVAVNAVNHALETYMYMKIRSGKDEREACPRCSSHRFGPTTDWGEDGELLSWSECSACGYATEAEQTGVMQGV
ncbi:MAG: hypothetical protein IPO80_00500 [Propionibacteriaceae bacterium]|nr:hypothetical protein [Propionibacteriaceae bacterium]